MRKSKQLENQSAHASAIFDGDEALAERSDPNSGPEDLGEFASEVQSFVTRRNEMARKLNKEIEAAERKLAELRRTKARLFPEGSLEILSEPERQERKPKRTSKAAKNAQESSDVQAAKEFVSGSESSRLVIHRIDDDLETDNGTGSLANRNNEAAETLSSQQVDTVVGAGAQYLDLGEFLRTRPLLAFNPGRAAEPLPKVFDLPLVDLLNYEPLITGAFQHHAAIDRRLDSVPLLAVESGHVLSALGLGHMHSLTLPNPSGIAYQSPTLATTAPLVARPGIAQFILQRSHDIARENAA